MEKFFFWKGRVALYAILKAMDIGSDDEVILPAFTCVVVPNVVKYLGAYPVYVDIDPDTYNIDSGKIGEKITRKTRAIIAQNTFGLSPDLDPVMELAKRHNLRVIEDCAHGYGGIYKGRENGSIADASFFSTQWNKPFSTGLGGFAVAKYQELAGKIKEMEGLAVSPSVTERISLSLQLFAGDHFLNGRTYWMLLGLYRRLSSHNIITGSSQGYELESPEMPEDFLKGFSGVQKRRFEKELDVIEKNIAHRRKTAAIYKEMVESLGIGRPAEPAYAVHTYLKFPLLVEDREMFLKSAEDARVEIGDWFLSPLHPVKENLQLWDYRYGENPVAEFVSSHIVNLPTHMDIDERYIEKVRVFIENHKNELIPYREVRKRSGV